MQYIAYVTKGLEEVLKLELQQRLEEFSIEEISGKRIVFSSSSPLDQLTNLKTVDDLGILINQSDNVKNADDIVSLLDKNSLLKVQEIIKEFREFDNKSFSITISIAKSTLKPPEVSLSIQKYLTDNFSWNYIELDHTNFDIRIFIDGKKVYISVRLTKESLHNRPYKNFSKKGSLKPTVAAAMVILATNFQKNLKIVDDFCGSGIILCESYLKGNEVFGGDIDIESVEITKNNLSNLGLNPKNYIKTLDARKTNWQESFFDCAISNLPWDKQIEVKSITSLYEDSIKEYFRTLKPNGTLCVIVSKPELFIKYIKKFRPNANIKTFKIGLLGQNPTIIIANQY